MKYCTRNTSYSLCFFRPMLKSVIFLSVSTILVCFSVYGNAECLLQLDEDFPRYSRKESKKLQKENFKTRKRKKGPTSLKTNEHRGFYPGSEIYRQKAYKKEQNE